MKKINFINRLIKAIKEVKYSVQVEISYLAYIERIKMINYLLNDSRYKDKRHLIPFGYKLYSQNDEDGIIKEIFRRIGTTNKIFVEFGVGDGLENNTLALLFEDWQGLWIEGSAEYCSKITKGYPNTIAKKQLTVTNAYINKDNINSLISSYVSGQIDLLSVDIDGNDYHVFEAISCISPRLVVIEYNPKFPPPIRYCMEYNENHIWDGSDHFGASLKFLEEKMTNKQYCLVGCNLAGGNAFFVKNDLVQNLFYEPFTAEIHYESFKKSLYKIQTGHEPSYNTLEKRVI